MPDIIYMFAMSLDGYIARPDGTFDWLENFPADDDYDFDAFLNSLSGIVMGRGSYDAVRERWDYGRWPCTIASNQPIDGLPENAQAVAGSPADLLDNLRQRGGDGRIWLFGGGELAKSFMEAGLLGTVELGLIPVVLGSGRPAFGGAQPDRWMDLDFAKPLANGAVHLRYRVRT